MEPSGSVQCSVQCSAQCSVQCSAQCSAQRSPGSHNSVRTNPYQTPSVFLAANLRRVPNFVFFHFGDSPASAFCVPTFRDTLFHLHTLAISFKLFFLFSPPMKLHNEELNDLYCSPNIVQIIKSRRMRWAWNMALMWERRGAYRVWWGNLRERDHLMDLGVDGRIISK